MKLMIIAKNQGNSHMFLVQPTHSEFGASISWAYVGIVVIILAWAGCICLNLKPRWCHHC